MRIVVLAPHFAEYAYALATSLAARHDVLLIGERGSVERELGTCTPPGLAPRLRLHLVVRERSVTSIVRNAQEIVRAVRTFHPDVIHAQEVIFDFVSLAILILREYPVVLTVHDPIPHSGEAHRGIRRRYAAYQRFLRRRADAAIVHGSLLREQLELSCPSLSGRVHVLAHGVLGRLPGDAAPTPRPREPGRVLFLGRMHAYKGLDVFLDAMNLIAAGRNGVVAVIAGRGPALDELRPRFAGRADTEVHDGYVPRADLVRLVDEATVVALPYLDGTQSGIALLAMGRGRAMVATRVGSLPEVVQHGRNGLLVEPGDAVDLAAAIAALLDSPGTTQRFNDENAAMAENKFGWPGIAAATVRVYSDALARPRRRRHGLTPAEGEL